MGMMMEMTGTMVREITEVETTKLTLKFDVLPETKLQHLLKLRINT